LGQLERAHPRSIAGPEGTACDHRLQYALTPLTVQGRQRLASSGDV
jgi:hypothetical protein